MTSVALPLEGGLVYSIVGACDQDCGDLALRIYDGNREIDEDVTVDDYPLLAVDVSEGRTYRLEIIMAGCSTEPCRYGVGVFTKQ